jgi:hypothetical protein
MFFLQLIIFNKTWQTYSFLLLIEHGCWTVMPWNAHYLFEYGSFSMSSWATAYRISCLLVCPSFLSLVVPTVIPYLETGNEKRWAVPYSGNFVLKRGMERSATIYRTEVERWHVRVTDLAVHAQPWPSMHSATALSVHAPRRRLGCPRAALPLWCPTLKQGWSVLIRILMSYQYRSINA